MKRQPIRADFVSLLKREPVGGKQFADREALFVYGAPVETALVQRLKPPDTDHIRRLLETARPEAFVCANDRTAGHLMHTLIGLGRRVPEDVRIVGLLVCFLSKWGCRRSGTGAATGNGAGNVRFSQSLPLG